MFDIILFAKFFIRIIIDAFINSICNRVSFGSSKGSMVETLVFETPTPLPEHAEREFSFPPEQTNPAIASKHSNAQENVCMNSFLDDSGIELQEE